MLIKKYKYKNGDGFAVTVGKPPKEAIQSDIICLHTAKGKKGTSQYYTPDEAMAIAIGLIEAIDHVLGKKFYKRFREHSF